MDIDPEYSRFFAGGLDGKAMFDLAGFGLHRLREAGIGQAEWVRHCTYGNADRFYSYRRSCHLNEPDYGRLIASITL
jgi:copper oxidase (laccase) domain-containing protein